MKRIFVLLGNYPMMVPDIIRQVVAEQEDMELVGDCRGPMKILQETGRTKADVVILSQEGSDEIGLCSQLLAVYPDLIILSVTPEMDAAFTQKICSQRKALVPTEIENLAQTLRQTAKCASEE